MKSYNVVEVVGKKFICLDMVAMQGVMNVKPFN